MQGRRGLHDRAGRMPALVSAQALDRPHAQGAGGAVSQGREGRMSARLRSLPQEMVRDYRGAKLGTTGKGATVFTVTP